MPDIPVILDVDTGVDDALALLLAVRHPGVDLRAVTCVAGNVGVDQVVANTQYVLDAAGAADIPVARGAARPLLAEPDPADHWHGPDGLAGFSRPSDRRLSPLSAVELLRRELMAAVGTGERITLVPLAPLTNIALLLSTHPEVAAGIERIVFMGGSASVGNATAVAEFNIWHDPEAAAITLAAAGDLAVPITMYGLDVFNEVRLTADQVARAGSPGDPGAQLAAAMIERQCRAHGFDTLTIGDAGAVCAVIDPEGLAAQRFPVRVETGHGFGRGQTVVDRRIWTTGVEHGPHGRARTEVDVALERRCGPVHGSVGPDGLRRLTAMDFGTLALICLVGLVGPLLALPRWAHVPVVVGELIIGALLGATGIGALDAGDPTFTFLGEIGFALVMFVAGSHVPIRDPALRTGIRVGALRALGVGILAVPAGLLVAGLFGTGHGALYAVLIASSSAALILPIIGGTKASGRPIAEFLPQVALADTACIVALPLVIDPAHAGRAAVGAISVTGCAVLLYLLIRRLDLGGGLRRFRKVSKRHHYALELRLSLAILFALAALATLLHVSILLAGFSFGLAVAAVGPPRRLARQLFALTEGFFGPLFFVWLGASIDLRDLFTHAPAVGLGVALGITPVVVHGLMALTRQPMPLAVLTAAQLGVPVAAATVGTQLGLLGPGEAPALLLGALVTIAVAAVAARRVDGIGDPPGTPSDSPA